MSTTRKNKQEKVPAEEAAKEETKFEAEKPRGEEPTSGEPSKEKPARKSPGKFQRFLRSVAVGLILIAVGAAALFFGVYQPRVNELNAQIKSLQAEVGAANAKVTAASQEGDRLKSVESELNQAKEEISNLKKQLDIMSAKKSVYQIQSDVNAARVALLLDDITGAEQSIKYLIQNLNTLNVPAFPDITKNLETRLINIQTLISTDKDTALENLKELYNDMIRLADNIK